jgi:hypothetical protein
MEIAPDGTRLRPRSRFARFTNLPELQQMFRAFADVQTADRLDLPRPRLRGGQATIVSCPMSETQRALQAGLVERYDRLRTQRVDPREDNALAITTDGRKLALEARLLSPTAPAFADSKIQALVANVASLWQRTAATRGTQLIFCDLGVHPTPWGYSVYQEITHALVQRGVPRAEIAAVGEADSDARKHALFEKVRSGAVRVLLGSTQKLGAGTNVQQRLVALQHLDAPWKAAEVEQRDGRILRPGTLHDEVAIYRYVTEGSFDAYMWQALETKARFIAQVMSGDLSLRQAEDIDSEALSYAQVKAIASGNPAVLTLAEVDAELARLRVLHKHHSDEQYLARLHARQLPNTIVRLEQRLAALTQDMATAEAHKGDPLTIGNRTCLRDEAVAHLAACLKDIPSIVLQRRQVPLGRYQGLPFALVLSPAHDPEICVEGATTRLGTLSREHHGPRAILNAVERVIDGYGAVRASTEKELALAQGQLRDYRARLGADFAHGAYLAALSDLRQQLATALSAPEAAADGAAGPPLDTLVANVKALQAKHRIEAATERLSRRSAATAAEPVTTRIRRRRTPEPPPQPEAEPTAPAPLPLPAPPSAAALTLLDIPVPCGGDTRNAPTTPARASRKRARRHARTPATQLRLF